MPFVNESTSVSVTNTATWYLPCLFIVSDEIQASNRIRAILEIDSVGIPIKKATWSEDGRQGSLNVELARLSDRVSLTRDSILKFYAQKYITGSWTTVKTYCDGALLASSSHTLQNDGVNPNDSYSFTVKTLLQQRLDMTPDQTVVLYDPDKTTVNEEDIEVIPDIDGNESTPTVTPIASMTLADILEWFADTIGCDGYQTNINAAAWPLARIDFPATQPYWNAIASEIGNHEPKLSIDEDNFLVIRDGTLLDALVTRTLTASTYQNLTYSRNIERFKGSLVTAQFSGGWDYYVFDQEPVERWFGGVVGQWPMTRNVKWIQKFYRNGFNTPVFQQTAINQEVTYASGYVPISGMAESFSYSFGQGGVRMRRHNQKQWGTAKVPQSWANEQFTIPTPFFSFGLYTGSEDGFSSASDDTFVEVFALTGATQTTYSYKSVYGGTEIVSLTQSDAESKGLITIDNENPMLGEPFEQPALRSQESGNLASGQGSRWGETDYRQEAQETGRKGTREVRLATRGHSRLNSTSGMPTETYFDRRVGDISEGENRTESKPIKIIEGADSTATLWRSVNGGSAPLEILRPLAIRLNKKQDYPGGIDATLAYYDETIKVGVAMDVSDRDGNDLGTYEIESYTDEFNNILEGGISTQVTGRQVG